VEDKSLSHLGQSMGAFNMIYIEDYVKTAATLTSRGFAEKIDCVSETL